MPLQTSPEASLMEGRGRFTFNPTGGKPISVWYYIPSGLTTSSPILFVMHGVKRDGQKYRDDWIPYAARDKFLVLAPEFSETDYPNAEGYNLGNMVTDSGQANPKSAWGFTLIEAIFDYVKHLTGSRVETYNIYGHSAGAQFVHRLVIFLPEARINRAIAANAGWYTLPTHTVKFPYGLDQSGITEEQVQSALRQRLIILLGEEDTDGDHEHLRSTPEAAAQGKNRLERGHYFFEVAQSQKAIPFNWTLETVPGVGHNSSKITGFASRLLQ
jgi:poly(3-hydroxybutyrate) depolymerase